MIRTPEFRSGALLWLCLLATGLLLRPGLSGEFSFDDVVNLNGLTALGQEPGFYRLWQFLTHGVSSEIGRPLALLSFAAQYPSWPNHPADFIGVNILLHLLNGALLYWILSSWQRLTGDRRQLLPLMVTALWLLAPLQANAVLYVVQRMAVLSATFVLLGLALHLKGRAAGLEQRNTAALALMTLGACVGLGLGTLAKESAALYPLLVVVLEFTLLRNVPRPARWPAWSAVMLGAPLLLLCGYLLNRSLGLAVEFSYRPYSLGERLLTEARVLFLYLKELFLPSLYSIRILYDDLPISRSLTAPWTTLPAVLAWPLLLGLAIRMRKRWTGFSFAVLWFLAAHALESTFLPLELAFLHRNYVAVIGPLVGLVWLAYTLAGHPRLRRLRPLFPLAAVAYLALVAVSLHQTATLWGDPREQARHWILRQPDSRRAVLVYVGYLYRYGLAERADKVLSEAQHRWPDDAALRMARMHGACFYPQMSPPDLAQFTASLPRNDGEMPAVIGTIDQLLSDMEAGRCDRYRPAELRRLLEVAATAPAFRVARQNLTILLSRAYELEGDRARAMAQLERAIRMHPRLDLLQQAVFWALQAGDVPRAREHLATAETSPRIAEFRRWTYRRELEMLRELVARFDSPEDAAPAGR